MGRPNNQGGWKIPQDEISKGGRNKRGGWKFGLTMQQSAQMRKAPINITASKYFSEPCHRYLIHDSGNSTKVLTFADFS